MSLSILHFSDIHLKNSDNKIMTRLDELKRACASALPYGNDTVILISGDIAFSGKEDEYNIASTLIKSISDYLVEQRGVNIHFCFAPGNHDCNFTSSNSVRNLLLENIKPATVDDEIYRQISSVQAAYHSFSEEYETSNAQLVYIKEIEVDKNRILFVLINSSWMSVLKEVPGHLLLPEQLFPQIDTRNYKMVVSVQHHPLNWLHQDCIASVNTFFRSTTDILFLGHEHRKDSYRMQGAKWTFKQIQGKELQNSDGEDSAFSVHNFDKGFQTCESIDFEWSSTDIGYVRKGENIWQYHKNPALCNSVYQLNQNAFDNLNDIGVLLTHSSKEDISLKDLFVWPELMKIDPYSESSSVERIRDNIFHEITKGQLSVVIGGTSCGKTSLAKMVAMSYAEEDICCLYINCHTIKGNNVDALKKSIEAAFSQQYNSDNLEQFRQLPVEQRAIIIDDFDMMLTRANRRDAILEYLFHYFGKTIIFSSSDFEVLTIVSCPCLRGADIGCFDILPLGNKKRKELVSRWYYLGRDTDYEPDIEEKIEKSINQIDIFLGNGASFIPAIPVFILGVLQNTDALNPTSGSQYGFLYETLILKSLSVIADDYTQSGSYDIDVSILSQLAFKMLTERRTFFTTDELEKLIEAFNTDQRLCIKPDDLLTRMLKARIVTLSSKYEKNYKFKYPYIYYYFAGRYIAYHYQENSVQSMIDYMSRRLYIEEYGNIIVFVCHFANNENMILSIMVNSYDTLSNYTPFDFHSAHPLFNDIQTTIESLLPKQIGSNDDVPKNKEQSLVAMDDAGINDGHVTESNGEIIDEFSEKEKDLADITASLKILDVLGQILQNYPGGVQGDLKTEIILEMHNLGMRAFQAVVEMAKFLEEDLVNAVAEEAKRRKRYVSRDQIVEATHKFLIMLYSNAARGMINKIAASMNSKFLLPAAQEIFSTHASLSSTLVLQELKINYLRDFSPNEVANLYDNLLKRKELFASGILKASVAHYLNYNICDYKLRAQLCNRFDLSDRAAFLEAHKNSQI